MGRMQPDENKFQKQLKKSVLKQICILLTIGCFCCLFGMWFINLYTNIQNAKNNLNSLKDFFIDLYQDDQIFLLNQELNGYEIQLLKDEISAEDFEFIYHRYTNNFSVQHDFIISSADNEIYFSTYDDSSLTNYMINYYNAVCYHAKDIEKDEIYNSVYYSGKGFSDYIYIKPIYEGEKQIGFIGLFVSGSDWNYYLSSNSYDGIITDERNNVIYCSKASFMGNVGKYYDNHSTMITLDGARYCTQRERLSEYRINIYSLVYYPPNATWVLALILVFVMGVSWLIIVQIMSGTMAKYNAREIDRLVKEIRIIRKEDPDYRLHEDSGNEFDEVAHQINHMRDGIVALNEKNIELLQLNNEIELNQLTEQINPHFMYNTLEIIRNLITFNPEEAMNLIEEFTQILRYSIDRSRKYVFLGEDISYIRDYLNIQKRRFGKRFGYEIDIDNNCNKCVIPKLLIQPIIENSIKYGFKKQMEVQVRIKGWMETGMLVLQVEDNGPGLNQEELDLLNKRIRQVRDDSGSNGLHNISRRLVLKYGENSGVFIEKREEKGLRVLIKVKEKNWGQEHV